jgi:predicted SAM-dependent methyltransferase
MLFNHNNMLFNHNNMLFNHNFIILYYVILCYIMFRTICVICSNKLKSFFTLDHFPKKMICTKNPIIECDELSFSICSNCSTIQLDKLIPLNVLYDGGHNYASIGKTWEKFFIFFCNEINAFVNNKTILEIGCPSAKIASKLNNYDKWYIVEPNKNNNIFFKDKIIFIESFFDDLFTINNKIDVIIHSHLFEHIYEPSKFLDKCYDILCENGLMIFAIPDMDFIANNNLSPCNGIFFEHNIFYNKENVSFLLIKHGFKINNIVDYENHSIIFIVEKCAKNNTIENIKLSDDYSHLFQKSITQTYHFIEKCMNIIFLNPDNKVYIFGASYNTQFIIYFFQNKKIVFDGILDNCAEKQGNYLFGTQICIYSPQIICENKSIVILKNGYYCEEIQVQLLNIKSDVIIIV